MCEFFQKSQKSVTLIADTLWNMRGTKELDYFVFTDSLHAKNKHALSIPSECLAYHQI